MTLKGRKSKPPNQKSAGQLQAAPAPTLTIQQKKRPRSAISDQGSTKSTPSAQPRPQAGVPFEDNMAEFFDISDEYDGDWSAAVIAEQPPLPVIRPEKSGSHPPHPQTCPMPLAGSAPFAEMLRSATDSVQ